jgi:formate/nitrite transporter FocA (FNT family)
MSERTSTASEPTVEDAATELSEEEKEDVHRRVPPRVGVVHETIRLQGEHELHRPVSALAWSGLAAGMSMGFSLAACGILRAALPDRPWRHLVVQLGYTIGFLVVIVGRQQLFTENTLTPIIPLLHNRDLKTLWRVARLWAIVLSANLIGGAAFACASARTNIFKPEVKKAFESLGRAALDGSGGVHFMRAILAGFLIALMVWLLGNAEESRVSVIIIVTYLVGAAELAHVIAGSIEVLYLVWAGVADLGTFLTQFFLPTLAGNIVGGVTLVAVVNHAQTVADAA